jgi:hypothetical protein
VQELMGRKSKKVGDGELLFLEWVGEDVWGGRGGFPALKRVWS